VEHKLRSSPLIRDAMVVGTNRPQPAVLFIPADPTNSDLTSLIEEINASIPKHSRIVPELVKSLPPTSEFLVSDKRSLKRTKSVALFQSEIDDLYTAYAGEADGGEELKDLNAAKDVVSAVLSRMFDRIIGMDEDLFDLGMDSLAAIQVRNTIQRRVSLPSPLVPNVVFENPTPAALAQHLWAYATGEASVAVDMDQEARRMVEEGRAALLPRHKTSNGHAINGHAINGHAINGDAANGHSMNGDKPKTVLLTGATGSLGSHVLQQLVRNGIKKITCPVRAKDDSHAIERVEESLRRRKLPSIKKLEASGSRIVCLASDLSDPRLGLSHERYHDLRSEIGSTIHAAWPVNFNLPLSSFQPHVTATVNLLNLTAASRFILLSSVSVASRWPAPTLVPEDTLPDPTVAESIGYAKSKWVAETLTSSAGGTIIRVGQLCGDSVHGVWNENEAVPAVIKAAQIMGSLPATLPGGSNWLPVDDAAKAITTLSTAKDGGGVYNLVNPTPTPWTKVLDCLAEPKNLGEGVDVIPFAQWVENLREATDSTDDMEGNPALKLVGYFTTEKEWKEVEFDTETLRRDSGVEFGRVGGEEVGRMLKAWRRSGFLR